MSHALWTNAVDKGVTELAIVTTRDYGNDNIYDVVAFKLDGTVPPEAIAEIAPKADRLADSANLREHGYVYSSLEPWDGGGSIWISKKPQFRELSQHENGIYVVPVQRLAGNDEPRWLAWVREGGVLHIAIVYKP